MTALETEGREWVRREILGELVRCESRLGNAMAANTHFVELVIRDPHHRDWNLAPFGWESPVSTPALQAAARHWLVHPAEGVRLVGAALLMSDAQGIAEAIAELKRLARLTDEYIGPQARVLLWDVEPAGESPSREELERRRRDIERMPESIRAGPWYRLGRAHARRLDAEEAIGAYLRVFIAHAEQDELAARSGLEAAVLLQQLNRSEEAETVLHEVITRFPESRVISEARGRLQPPVTQP
jgi:tetratricopeptide (TPR) repeat protein